MDEREAGGGKENQGSPPAPHFPILHALCAHDIQDRQIQRARKQVGSWEGAGQEATATDRLRSVECPLGEMDMLWNHNVVNRPDAAELHTLKC